MQYVFIFYFYINCSIPSAVLYTTDIGVFMTSKKRSDVKKIAVRKDAQALQKSRENLAAAEIGSM